MDISIRELKANPGAAIKRVQAGERVCITAHRKVVAELVAPGSPQADPGADGAGDVLAAAEAAAIARLMTSGLITEPASRPFCLPQSVKLPESPDRATVSDLVIDARGPR